MVIKYHISPYPALLEDMVVRIYEASSPAAVVWTQVLPAPHNAPVTITANGLDSVVHIVRLYTAVSASLLHEYNIEPVTDIITIFDPIRFRIGDGNPLTPIANTDSYVNALLLGLTVEDYLVYRRGMGYLNPNEGEYINDDINGGFTLPAPDVFNDEEDFLIQRNTKAVSTIVNDSVVGKWFGGFVDITVTELVYDPSHLRKLFRFHNISGYKFPAAAAIPIGYAFVYQHYNPYVGLVGSGTIYFDNAPVIFGNTFVNALTIKQNQQLAVVFDGTNWNIIYLGESSFYNPLPGYLPFTLVVAGEFQIPAGPALAGDLPSGNPVYTIQHNQNIAGDYMVICNIKSLAEAKLTVNNKVTVTWQHHPTDQANAFKVCLREYAPEAQNIAVSWIIIKL